MFGWRESTWALRVITGTLFGGGSIWFAFPLIQKCLLETPPAPPPTPRGTAATSARYILWQCSPRITPLRRSGHPWKDVHIPQKGGIQCGRGQAKEHSLLVEASVDWLRACQVLSRLLASE